MLKKTYSFNVELDFDTTITKKIFYSAKNKPACSIVRYPLRIEILSSKMKIEELKAIKIIVEIGEN